MTNLTSEPYIPLTDNEQDEEAQAGLRRLGITRAMMLKWAETDDYDFITAGMVLPYMTQRDARILEMRRFEHQVGLPLEPQQSDPVSTPRLPMAETKDEYNEEERDWLSRIAPDLVYGEAGFLPPDQPKIQWISDLTNAQNQGDGVTMLRLLTIGNGFPKAHVAHFRANAYQILGYPELTLLFRRLAAREFIDRTEYQILLLNDLWQYQKLNEAQELAKSLLGRPTITGDDAISIVSILMMVSRLIVKFRGQSREALLPYAQISLQALEPLFKSGSSATGLVSRDILGLLTLGAVYNLLGRRQDAVSAYSSAIEKNPRDGNLFYLRGSVQVESHTALADYEQAIQFHIKNALPYILVAEHELQNGNVVRSKKLSKSAYAKAGDDKRIQALATSMLARVELVIGTQPVNEILERFQYAISLDPQNADLRANFELVKKMVDEITSDQKIVQTTERSHSRKSGGLKEQSTIMTQTFSPADNKITRENGTPVWDLIDFTNSSKQTLKTLNHKLMQDVMSGLSLAA